MLLIKTKKEHLSTVVKSATHALMNFPKHAKPGEIILIAQTKKELKRGEKPIKYKMELRQIRKDRKRESDEIFGRPWTYIVEGRNCLPLKTPFDINEVLGKNGYRQGGTFFYVDEDDAQVIADRGYLEVIDT